MKGKRIKIKMGMKGEKNLDKNGNERGKEFR